ncbi:hypothetical protein I7V28_19155 [Lelliottia amnigena]|uniref:hypothetical protein n=1 Tax=Lelliottia TaxID=1330545 RepID=UPI00192B85AD|nr:MULTISPECIES: hypothetical protein [Lelliottia]MBL5885623.1 hypothetical protein [Lelliottia aquatilis]MBL5923201.1 hypothetical protein [Lelliottia amnigena]MBL5932111.1 hypothetical protein [Lelliottia amnigena]
MSPLVIAEHNKKLFWPDDLDEPGQSYQKLANIKDDGGDEYEVILEDDGGEMARLYLRHIKTNSVAANYLLEFGLTPPDDLPGRIPQVTSVFVDVEYRQVHLSQHVYRLIMSHYGVVLSDTHQTSGGMVIWLQMAEDDAVQINVMQVRGSHLEYRLIDGQPEAYIGDIENLELAGGTIWGDPNQVISQKILQQIGFVPAYTDKSNIALAARPV